jgi:DNA-binding cell septation regulator SpoVG
MIYCYDLKNRQQSGLIPIKSICYEKNLYEVTNDQGEIILQNYLEKVFGLLERMFSTYRTKLERKAFNEENYKIRCFLTREEKIFWTTFIVVQTLRSPQILREAAKALKDVVGEGLNDAQARNISRLYCLPFFREINENTSEAVLFTRLLEPMMDMSFAVCVDKESRIITSDKTMYVYAPKFPTKEYEKIIFPITAEICLILLGGEEKKEYKRKNFLFPINDSTRKMIVQAISDAAFERIYANHALDGREKAWVEEVQNNKVTQRMHKQV